VLIEQLNLRINDLEANQNLYSAVKLNFDLLVDYSNKTSKEQTLHAPGISHENDILPTTNRTRRAFAKEWSH